MSRKESQKLGLTTINHNLQTVKSIPKPQRLLNATKKKKNKLHVLSLLVPCLSVTNPPRKERHVTLEMQNKCKET